MPDPRWRSELQRRLAPLRLPPARELEIVDELSAHLDDCYGERLAAGASDADARAAALAELDESDTLSRRLGALEQRAPVNPLIPGGSAGREGLVRGLLRDVRYAARSLAATPGFAAVALLMFALGTGVNAAMFSVVEAVVLRESFPDQSRIVHLIDLTHGARWALNASNEEVASLRASGIFDSISALTLAAPVLTGAGAPERVRIECVSASMGQVLRVEPVEGRWFLDAEDRPSGDPVIVLGDRLRRRLFGDAGSIGRILTLDGRAVTVVGVMPRGFGGVRMRDQDAWAPIGQGVGQPSAAGCVSRPAGNNVYARVRSDLSVADARARLEAMTGGARSLDDFQEATLGADARTTFLLLLGAVGFVLLIACANVANLLLGRALGRRREMATRLALGASASRLVRQMLTESVLLAVCGTLAGLASAWLGMEALVAMLPTVLPQVSNIGVDTRVLLAVLAAGVLAGVLAGVAPALQCTTRRLSPWLHDARAVSNRGRSWTRQLLVVGEVALSVALLIGAALMLRSFLELRPDNPGFDPSNKVVAMMRFAGPRYDAPAVRLTFLDELTMRLGRLPEVRGVSATNFVPLSGIVSAVPITIVGQAVGTDRSLAERFIFTVTVNYLEQMRIPIVRGRGFLPMDDERGPRVAVVSETAAIQLWKGRDPIGTRIVTDGGAFDRAPRLVVGVAKDTRMFGSTTDARPQIYVPMRQDPWTTVTLVVRADANALGTVGDAIRREAAAVDGTQVVSRIETFDDILGHSVQSWRFVMQLLGVFALMALGLAVCGLMAVVGASVAQRRREIGIRMALGARPGAVVGLVLRQALLWSTGGTAIGIALAAATTRFLSASLYGVTPLDRTTFIAAPALMVAATLIASYLPARRAAGVDPLVVLRAD